MIYIYQRTDCWSFMSYWFFTFLCFIRLPWHCNPIEQGSVRDINDVVYDGTEFLKLAYAFLSTNWIFQLNIYIFFSGMTAYIWIGFAFGINLFLYWNSRLVKYWRLFILFYFAPSECFILNFILGVCLFASHILNQIFWD